MPTKWDQMSATQQARTAQIARRLIKAMKQGKSPDNKMALSFLNQCSDALHRGERLTSCRVGDDCPPNMNDFVDEDFYYKRSVDDDEVLQCIPPKLLKKLGKAKSGEFDEFMSAIHSIYKNSNRIGRMYSWMQNAKCETAGQITGTDEDKEAMCDQMPGCHSATDKNGKFTKCEPNLDKLAAQYRQQQAEIDAIADRLTGSGMEAISDDEKLKDLLKQNSGMMSFGTKDTGTKTAELAAMALKKMDLQSKTKHEEVATGWAKIAATHQLDAQCRASASEGMDAKDCTSVKGVGDQPFCEPIDSEGNTIDDMGHTMTATDGCRVKGGKGYVYNVKTVEGGVKQVRDAPLRLTADEAADLSKAYTANDLIKRRDQHVALVNPKMAGGGGMFDTTPIDQILDGVEDSNTVTDWYEQKHFAVTDEKKVVTLQGEDVGKHHSGKLQMLRRSYPGPNAKIAFVWGGADSIDEDETNPVKAFTVKVYEGFADAEELKLDMKDVAAIVMIDAAAVIDEGEDGVVQVRPLPAANYKYMTELLKPPDDIFNLDHKPPAPPARYGAKLAKMVRDMGVGHLRWSQFMDFDPRAKFIDVAQGWKDGVVTNGLSVVPPRMLSANNVDPKDMDGFSVGDPVYDADGKIVERIMLNEKGNPDLPDGLGLANRTLFMYPDKPTPDARYLVPAHWTVDELVSFLQLPPEECVTPWPMVKEEEALKIGESYNHVVMNQTEQKQLTKADAIILQRWLGDVMANRLALGTFGYRQDKTEIQTKDDIKQMSGVVTKQTAPAKYMEDAEKLVTLKRDGKEMRLDQNLYDAIRRGILKEDHFWKEADRRLGSVAVGGGGKDKLHLIEKVRSVTSSLHPVHQQSEFVRNLQSIIEHADSAGILARKANIKARQQVWGKIMDAFKAECKNGPEWAKDLYKDATGHDCPDDDGGGGDDDGGGDGANADDPSATLSPSSPKPPPSGLEKFGWAKAKVSSTGGDPPIEEIRGYDIVGLNFLTYQATPVFVVRSSSDIESIAKALDIKYNNGKYDEECFNDNDDSSSEEDNDDSSSEEDIDMASI